MTRSLAILTALALAVTTLFSGVPAQAQSKSEVVIGLQCDRTGPTQIVGTVICPAMHDYIALVNSKGGVEGRKIKALEIDHEYKVPPAVSPLMSMPAMSPAAAAEVGAAKACWGALENGHPWR